MTSTLVLSTGVLAACVIVALVVRRRQRRAAWRELFDAPRRAVDGRPPLATLPARHLETRRDGVRLGPVSKVAGVEVTDEALAFAARGSLCIPLAEVVDARFVARHGRVRSDGMGVVLRVDWAHDGRALVSWLLLVGRRLDAERLRREVHLRAGRLRPVTRG
jgi:hypothetical protein